MIHLELDKQINAKPTSVWQLLGDFMHLYKFAPEITKTDALTEGAIKVGSRRRNHFKNGSSLVETIIEWEPKSMHHRIELSELGSMPLVAAYSSMYVESIGESKCRVVWTFDYKVKYGPFGWLLGQTMLKMVMKKIIRGNLEGLEKTVTSK